MAIHDLPVAGGTNVVFHGHDHLFAKEDLDEVVYQLVPQPAHLRYGNTRSAAEYGYVDGVVLGSSGYVRVTVSPERAELAYVTSYLPRDENAERKNGAVAHSYSVYPGVNVQTKKTY